MLRGLPRQVSASASEVGRQASCYISPRVISSSPFKSVGSLCSAKFAPLAQQQTAAEDSRMIALRAGLTHVPNRIAEMFGVGASQPRELLHRGGRPSLCSFVGVSVQRLSALLYQEQMVYGLQFSRQPK